MQRTVNPTADFVDVLPIPGFAEGGADSTADGRLRWRIETFLNSRVPDLPDLHVAVSGNTVVLGGTVPSAHTRWLSLECCRHVAGVARVVDEMTVVAESVR